MKIVSWIKRSRSTSQAVNSPPAAPAQESVHIKEGAQPVESADVAKETPRRIVSKKRKVGLRSVLIVFLGFIAVGLARVARDSKGTSRVMESRYRAVYSALWR